MIKCDYLGQNGGLSVNEIITDSPRAAGADSAAVALLW